MTRKLSIEAGNGIGRRPLLKTVGLGIAGTALMAGTVAAHPKPTKTHTLHEGDSVSVGDGEVKAYATTNPAGKLSSLGAYIDANAFAAFDTDETSPHEAVEAHLHFPGTVDTHQFTFMGFHFNPLGHPPAPFYTVPHFDFHFYMMDDGDVEDIPFGPATYSIPAAQMPEDYSRIPVLDTDSDSVPDAPLVEGGMGEHLADLSSPEFQPGGEFTHTMIYGAYDSDGDDVGRLTFVEPMVTHAFLDDLTEELEVEMKVPDEYFTADDYPTQYVIKPAHGGVYVSIDGFEEFPGPSA